MPYSFINMLFISAGIFDYKLRPHILSVGTTANAGLMIELGLDISQRNPTYTATTQSKEEIIDNHMSVLCSFGLSMKIEDCGLPLLYWIPKLYKCSYKQHYIAGAAKSLYKIITSILTAVKTCLQRYNDIIFSRGGVNQMWILKISKDWKL